MSLDTRESDVVVSGDTNADTNTDTDADADADSIDRLTGATLRKALHQSFDCRTFLHARVPITSWLPSYVPTRHLIGDVIAGITVGLMIIPQGLGYATVAGVPQVYGLYSAFIGVFIYVIFGGSKDINVGPTAILSLLSFQATGGNVELAIQMTMMAGIFQIGLSLLRLGLFVDLISNPVLSGFTSASAIQICLTQVGNICGFKVRDAVYYAVYDIFHDITKIRYPDLLLGLGSMVVLFFMSRLNRMFPNSRFMFQLCIGRNAIVVVSMSLISYLISLNHTVPWKLVGSVPSGLPSVAIPHLSLATVKHQASNVALSAVIGFLESIAIAQTFARQNGYAHRLSTNQELFTIGCANLFGSFFQSLPVTGSFSRTAVASQAGANTPMQGIVTGVLVLFALILLTPAFAWIPKTTLAAVVIIAAGNLVDVEICKRLWKQGTLGRVDLASLLIAFIGCLFLDIQYGLALGIAASLAITLVQMARPKYTIHGDVGIDELESGEKAMKTYSAPKAPSSLAAPTGVTIPSTSSRIPDPILILELHCSIVFFNIGHLNTLLHKVEVEHFELIPQKLDDFSERPSNTAEASSDADDLYLPSDSANGIVAHADSSVLMSHPSRVTVASNGFDSSTRVVPSSSFGSRLLGDEHSQLLTTPTVIRLRRCRMRVLLLDCSSVNVTDTSGVRGILQTIDDLSKRPVPVDVHFACARDHLKELILLALDENAPYSADEFEQHFHESVDQAVAAIRVQYQL